MVQRGGHVRPYTEDEDARIRACSRGDLQALAEKLGRSLKGIRARRYLLTAGSRTMPMHRHFEVGQRGKKASRPFGPPLARPSWFEEDVDSMLHPAPRQRAPHSGGSNSRVTRLLGALVLLGLSALPAMAQQAGNLRVKTDAGSETLVTMTAQGAGTQDSQALANIYQRGVIVFMNISAISGTVAVVPVIQGRDPVSGLYYDICVGTTRTATGLYTLGVHPSAVASVETCNAILPVAWRVEVRHGAGSTPSTTGTVSANLVN